MTLVKSSPMREVAPVRKILVALDAGPGDIFLLADSRRLASMFQAELLLFHVADGWSARLQQTLKLEDSEEMHGDRAYLENCEQGLRQEGVMTSIHLAQGDPAAEIVRAAEEFHCDLIALASHHHRFLADVFLGSTIDSVRHRTRRPLWITSPPPESASMPSTTTK